MCDKKKIRKITTWTYWKPAIPYYPCPKSTYSPIFHLWLIFYVLDCWLSYISWPSICIYWQLLHSDRWAAVVPFHNKAELYISGFYTTECHIVIAFHIDLWILWTKLLLCLFYCIENGDVYSASIHIIVCVCFSGSFYPTITRNMEQFRGKNIKNDAFIA